MRVAPLRALRATFRVPVGLTRVIALLLPAIVLAAAAARATLPGEWEGFGGPIGWDGPVSVMIEDGENIVIGGEFSRVDWTDHRHIVMRDSTRYRLVGDGAPGPVYALISSSQGLIAGGWWLGDLPIEYSSFVSRWDGAEWHRMADGFNNRVNALAEYGGEIVAGGLFTRAGTLALGRIARWTGDEWLPIGGAGFDGDVNALLLYEGNLVAAGKFTSVDGTAAAGLAVWDGSSWSPFPGGGIEAGAWIQCLVVFEGDLVAGGSFETIGGASIPYLARWDGSSWNAFGAGVNGMVRALAPHAGGLAAGGVFSEAGGAPAGNVALWNGAGWDDLAGGADAEVSALISHDGKLLAGGRFQTVGGDSLAYFAYWDGAAWGTYPVPDVPGGMSGGGILGSDVRAILDTPEGLVVGGGFEMAGSTAVDGVARLRNGEWEAMGSALDGIVWDLYRFHDSLFAAGGGFDGVRVWDENLGDWATVGNNLNQTVACLDEYEGHLVAGGNFERTGDGDTVCYAARLVDDRWEPLGRLTGGTVRAFYHWGADLIAGGDITADTSTGAALNRVGRWDGERWWPMGDGMDDQVHDFEVYQGDLFAGGWFNNAGGAPASKIAWWNGSNWEAFTEIAIGATGVEKIVVYNGELYVLGRISIPGGGEIGRWTGDGWEGLDGGVSYESGYHSWVFDGVVLDDDNGPALYVGGRFIKAGPVYTERLAIWRTEGVATSVVSDGPSPAMLLAFLGPNRPNPFNPSTSIDYVIPEAAAVSLTIHDIGGRLVARLVSGREDAGAHTVIWNGTTDAGRAAASGVYFTRLQAGDRTEVRKITLVR